MKSGPVSIKMLTKMLKRPTETKRRRLSDSAARISRSPFRLSVIAPLSYEVTICIVVLGAPDLCPCACSPG